ncbi:MAG: IS4 family transposase [Methanoculleus sp.]
MEFDFDANWKLLLQFLPEGWEDKAWELGAISRRRKIRSPEMLLRIIFIHLADGCSMRETVTRAREADFVDISDVALFKRLKSSSDWLRWITANLVEQIYGPIQKPEWLQNFNTRLVDASVITEPGSTGTDWRLHYSIGLFSLACDHFQITDQTVGESLRNFPITRGDLLIADRTYGRINGMNYVVENGGDFIVRLANKAFKIMKNDHEEFHLLDHFRALDYGEIGDFDVFYRDSEGKLRPIRLCVIKKSPEVVERSKKKVIQNADKRQRTLSEETLELHEYVFVATSLPRDVATGEEIMSLYRMRWQIELAFKRLKSILNLGHLPKKDPDSAKAWLSGKMIIALLADAIIERGRFLSPWGYLLHTKRRRCAAYACR